MLNKNFQGSLTLREIRWPVPPREKYVGKNKKYLSQEGGKKGKEPSEDFSPLDFAACKRDLEGRGMQTNHTGGWDLETQGNRNLWKSQKKKFEKTVMVTLKTPR